MEERFLPNAVIAFKPAKSVSAYKEDINKLREQNDELTKATVEKDWAVGKQKSLYLSHRKSLDPKLNHLPKTRQCELLSINRSTIYYKPNMLRNDVEPKDRQNINQYVCFIEGM